MPNQNKILFYLLLVFCSGALSCKQASTKTENTTNTYYTEDHRPQYHFTPDSMWMNDPNGMVYFEGEYHLFYQYYPKDIVWGPMHWGHAVSTDMMHWQHLPIALYPDSLGLIFSGSAVIDKDNTAGFGKDAMVAIFTHHDVEGEKAGSSTYQNQSIAYSTDKGRTFTKYAGNPVVKNPGIKDFRDPKVRWHEASKQWVMVFAAYDKALFYTSPNLKDWTKSGEFGIQGDTRLWECPDIFPIHVEGSSEEKWILITSIQKEAPNGGTATSYFVGDFDGKTFKGDPKNQKWLDYGKDNYAMITWANIPDGRTLVLGWMSNWQYAQKVPTQKWRSAMTLPRTLRLLKDGSDYHLRSLPVKEVASIIKKTTSIDAQKINGSKVIADDKTKKLYKIEVSFQKPSKGSIYLKFANDANEQVLVGYNAETKKYYIDRNHAGASDFSKDFAGYSHRSSEL